MLARRVVGLGLVVGAVLHLTAAESRSQVRDTTRGRPDSVRVPAQVSPEDSAALAAADTTQPAAEDTLKAPLPQTPLPAPFGVAPRYRWDRDELLATGALSLLELLDPIPGITDYRTGWIASPQHATYLGNPAGVRLFLDNVELAPLSPRATTAIDLAEIPLWPLDELIVERGAGEIRVYMRTWTVERTTPHTRTDVYTGDEDTNIYRGFFGRRFSRGEALQVAGEQYGTAGRRFGDGDQLALLARVGVGRERWSADAFVLRANRTRPVHRPVLGGTGAVAPLNGRRTTAYLRAGIGSMAIGPWLQLVAASQEFQEHSPSSTAPIDTADTTRSVTDYIASAGMTWERLRVSAEARARVGGGETRFSQQARLSTFVGPFAARVFAEHGAVDSTMRVEASLETRLFGPLVVLASGAWVNDRREAAVKESAMFGRAEVGLVGSRASLTGGVVYRDSLALPPPEMFDRGFAPVAEGPVLGTIVSLRGKLWRDVGADVSFVGWESAGFYRPQFQATGRLYLQSDWLSRFPSGNFGILASGQLEYRDQVGFPTSGEPLFTGQSTVLSTLLEIRIVDAVLTWQMRNVIATPHELVPGFLMPGPVNLYGVRWFFWN